MIQFASPCVWNKASVAKRVTAGLTVDLKNKLLKTPLQKVQTILFILMCIDVIVLAEFLAKRS